MKLLFVLTLFLDLLTFLYMCVENLMSKLTHRVSENRRIVDFLSYRLVVLCIFCLCFSFPLIFSPVCTCVLKINKHIGRENRGIIWFFLLNITVTLTHSC